MVIIQSTLGFFISGFSFDFGIFFLEVFYFGDFKFAVYKWWDERIRKKKNRQMVGLERKK